MAQIHSASFLPSCALPHHKASDLSYPHASGSDLSVISPLALPRGAHGCFDQLVSASCPTKATSRATSTTHLPPIAGAFSPDVLKRQTSSQSASSRHVYSPLSPGVRGPPQSQPAQFLSPRHSPTPRDVPCHVQTQPRASSLSPTRRAQPVESPPADFVDFIQLLVANGGRLHSSTHSLTSCGSVQSRVTRPEHLRRLHQQNERIREAWEAERKYMEANRERAEEVYREERALMDQERMVWETEKEGLMQRNRELECRVERLQMQLLQIGAQAIHIPALQQAQGGDGGFREMKRPDHSRLSGSLQSGPVSGDATSSPAGPACQASLIPARQQAAQANPSHQQPPQQYQYQHQKQQRQAQQQASPSAFISPMNFLSTSSSGTTSLGAPTADPLQSIALSDEDAGPVPVIDVQEIHPDLEGIPIKASTIQKATFIDKPVSPAGSSSAGTSRSTSPLGHPKSPLDRPAMPDRDASSREQTLQVLKARPVERLTMHAGHTPNHSMSFLPTSVASAVSTRTSSGSNTPTLRREDFVDGAANDSTFSESGGQQDKGKGKGVDVPSDKFPLSAAKAHEGRDPVDALPLAEDDVEDRELTGPLHIRNIPAHDEIFLRRLSDKLVQVISSPEEALPAVLKDTVSAGKGPSGATWQDELSSASGYQEHQSSSKGGIGGRSTSRNSPKTTSDGTQEMDIPLKLKRSFNFGAPFGEFR